LYTARLFDIESQMQKIGFLTIVTVFLLTSSGTARAVAWELTPAVDRLTMHENLGEPTLSFDVAFVEGRFEVKNLRLSSSMWNSIAITEEVNLQLRTILQQAFEYWTRRFSVASEMVASGEFFIKYREILGGATSLLDVPVFYDEGETTVSGRVVGIAMLSDGRVLEPTVRRAVLHVSVGEEQIAVIPLTQRGLQVVPLPSPRYLPVGATGCCVLAVGLASGPIIGGALTFAKVCGLL
jgi:hypothetical protein